MLELDDVLLEGVLGVVEELPEETVELDSEPGITPPPTDAAAAVEKVVINVYLMIFKAL